MIINILLALSIGYALYLIFDFYKNGQGEAGNKIGAILILAVLCAIFWACFEQAGSSLTVWAETNNRLKLNIIDNNIRINFECVWLNMYMLNPIF